MLHQRMMLHHLYLLYDFKGVLSTPFTPSSSFFLFSSKMKSLEMKAWPPEGNGSFPIQTPHLEERKENTTGSVLSSSENLKQRTSSHA